MAEEVAVGPIDLELWMHREELLDGPQRSTIIKMCVAHGCYDRVFHCDVFAGLQQWSEMIEDSERHLVMVARILNYQVGRGRDSIHGAGKCLATVSTSPVWNVMSGSVSVGGANIHGMDVPLDAEDPQLICEPQGTPSGKRAEFKDCPRSQAS